MESITFGGLKFTFTKTLENYIVNLPLNVGKEKAVNTFIRWMISQEVCFYVHSSDEQGESLMYARKENETQFRFMYYSVHRPDMIIDSDYQLTERLPFVVESISEYKGNFYIFD